MRAALKTTFSLPIIAITMLFFASCTKQESQPPFTFVEASIDSVQSAIRAGRESCESIITGYLARIEAYDKKSGLNAIIFTNPNALARAKEIDVKISSGETQAARHH